MSSTGNFYKLWSQYIHRQQVRRRWNQSPNWMQTKISEEQVILRMFLYFSPSSSCHWLQSECSPALWSPENVPICRVESHLPLCCFTHLFLVSRRLRTEGERRGDESRVRQRSRAVMSRCWRGADCNLSGSNSTRMTCKIMYSTLESCCKLHNLLFIPIVREKNRYLVLV